MPESVTISKTSFPDYLDFARFREAGIEHLEQLGSDLWTDYNLHDPGITILEVLCYALTDLGYRTNLPIEDLIARTPEQRNRPDDNFFTAGEILTCNPVTIDDFRRLLIDVPGIRDAWLETTDRAEVPVYVNEEGCRLQFEPPGGADRGSEEAEAVRLPLGGLYRALLDVDPDVEVDACGDESRSYERAIREVRRILNRHRNLCEDVLDVVVLSEEEIAVCADVELTLDGNPEAVLLAIYRAIDDFLSPEVRFYSLQEMLERGKSPEEIFAGRPLLASSHGFIDPEELKATELRDELHASDLYQVIMDVEGVRGIESMTLTNYVNGIAQTRGEEWSVTLTPGHRPVLDLARTRINFSKDGLPFGVDRRKVREEFRKIREASTKAQLSVGQLDLPVPEGTHRDVGAFHSIQHEFPLVYGTGEFGPDTSGLEGDDLKRRLAQARQLKGFLLFFDQILANYLAQLAHVRDLFSFTPDSSPDRADLNHTYFTEPLTGVPRIDELLYGFEAGGAGSPPATSGASAADGSEGPAESQGDGAPADYAGYLQHIAESTDAYEERRNRFLDHLLARFAETFTDYVLLMYRINGERHDNPHLIETKTHFLKDYPELSRNRGRTFDYWAPNGVWNTENVAGLKKRVSRLVGIEDVSRRSLSHCIAVAVDGEYEFLVRQGDALLARSAAGYSDKAAASAAYDRFLEQAADERNYRRLAYDGFDHYGFRIVDEEDAELATYPSLFAAPEERDAARNALVGHVSRGDVFDVRTVRKGERYHFEVVVQAGDDPVVGTGLFREKAAAAQAAEEFMDQASDAERYENMTRGGFTHYGFVVVGEDDEALAEGPRLWPSATERDAAMLRLLGYVRAPVVSCRVEQTDQCYRAILYEASSEADAERRALLVAASRYPSAAAATRTFEEEILPLAADPGNYEQTHTDDGFGFVLHRGLSGDVVARHPHFYDTAQERNDRLTAVVLYVGDEPVRHATPGTKGAFDFEARDEDGRVLLRGVRSQPTEGRARSACRGAVYLARYRTYYRTRDDLGGSASFGFELVDRHGKLVAEHPHGYESDGARDEALDALIDLASRPRESGAVTCVVDGTPGSFTFELFLRRPGGGRRLLFVSAETFTEKRLAEKAYRRCVALAREARHYFRQDDLSFSLRERDEDGTWGAVVATHTQVYANESEREAAIELIRAYVRDDPHVYEAENVEGSYFLELANESGDLVLEGTETYPSGEGAEAEAQVFLDAAADERRYVRLETGPESCPYGFELRASPDPDSENSVGRLLATHARTYGSADARDARIDAIAAGVRDGSYEHRVAGTDCGHYFEHEVAGHRLRSTDRFPNDARAVRACIEAAALLADEANFTVPDEGPWTERLIVQDGKGRPTAVYTGPDDDLDGVPAEIAGHVAGGPEAELAYVRQPGGFQSRVMNAERTGVLLHGAETFRPAVAISPEPLFEDASDRDDAVRFLVDALTADPPEPVVFERDGRFHFSLEKDGETVLESRRGFDTEQAAHTAFDAFVHVGGDASSYHPFHHEADGAFGFEVFDEAGAERSEAAAWRACDRIAERAQDDDHFRRIRDANECLFGFELVTAGRATLAVHDTFYGAADAREVEIERIIRQVDDEGLHLVEHLLLRPRNPGSSLEGGEEADAVFPLENGCLDENGDICFLKSDPYSFRITVVLPYWPARFQNMSFRSFFERTIRAEAPAHVFARVCWVDTRRMWEFEQAYRAWLPTLASDEEDCGATPALNRLISAMCRLRNVYPEAILRECEDASQGAPVILNQTLLGSANPDRDAND